MSWSPKFYSKIFLFVGLTTLGKIFISLILIYLRCNFVIIGDIHQFNGHCLIPLDPWGEIKREKERNDERERIKNVCLLFYIKQGWQHPWFYPLRFIDGHKILSWTIWGTYEHVLIIEYLRSPKNNIFFQNGFETD